MKHLTKVIVVILTCISLHGQAQNMDSVINAKYTQSGIDTSSNFKQVYGDIRSGISAMSDALKIGVEHVYGVIVRQQQISAYSELIICVLLISLPFTYKKWVFKNENTFYYVLFFLPIIGASCYLALNFSNIISGILNPEYGAIKDIVHMVHNIQKTSAK